MNMPSSKLQPALLGGLLLGVLSALPLVRYGNYCCCLWVLAGGVTAAYLLQGGQRQPITLSDGAVVGLGAGLAGAVVWLVLQVPAERVESAMRTALMGRMASGGTLPDTADLPQSARVVIRALTENPALMFVVRAVFTLFISLVFSTLGGLIGAGLFRTKVTPPEPDAPPVIMP